MAVWRLDGQIEADGILECLPEERLVRGADPPLCAVGQAFADLSMQPCPARIRLGQPLPDGERGEMPHHALLLSWVADVQGAGLRRRRGSVGVVRGRAVAARDIERNEVAAVRGLSP